jgi:DNA-binding ferritin-like protein
MSYGCKHEHQDEPTVDSIDAVWRDPMDYDVQKHGPPYLPLTASQRAEVRGYITKQAAYYDANPMVMQGSPYDVLASALAALRAGYLLHQTAHWQTRGPTYYGDHLLYMRIYEETQEGVDGLAERLIGLTGDPTQVSLVQQTQLILQYVTAFHEVDPSPAPLPERLSRIGLRAEMMIIGALEEAIRRLESADAMTAGLDDLLPAISGKHEEFVYLLKQRSSSSNSEGYSYDRQG